MGNTRGRGDRDHGWPVTIGLSLLIVVLLFPRLSLADPSVEATLRDTPAMTPVGPGETIEYEALIRNSGDMPATDVTLTDQSGGNNTSFVTGSLRTTPVCGDDHFSTRPDTVLNGPSVLTNDTDPDGSGAVCIASGGSCLAVPLNVTSAQGGTVALNVDGTFTYTPPPSFVGTDTFTYAINDTDGNACLDAVGGATGATVSIAVTNASPVANAQMLSVNEDTVLPITLTGSDADLDDLTFSITTGPTNGTLSVVTNMPDNGMTADSATLTYTPNANFNGPDTFTFQVDDGNGGLDTASVDISVAPQQDSPTANPMLLTVMEDTLLAITLTGSDIDLDDLTFSITAGPTNGTLSVVTNVPDNGMTADSATLTYTPNANFFGSDSFTFQVDDGNGNTTTADVDITVEPINDAPTLAAIADVSIPEDAGQQTVNLTGIAADTNETQTLSVTALSDNTSLIPNPTVTYTSPNPTGSLQYTPVANQSGTAVITITVQDDGGMANGGVDTTIQMVTVTVTAVNDAPSITLNGNQTVDEDAGPQSVASFATGFSPGGGTDEAGQAILDFVVSNDNNSLFATQPDVTNNGTLTYTPAANATGSATVTIQVQDDGGTANGGVDLSVAQVFTITVDPVNDEPSFAVGPNQTVNEDAGAQSVNNWATSLDDGDPDVTQTLSFNITNNTNTALFAAGPAVSATGTLTYTPAANANGSATISLELMDDGGTTNPGDDDTSPTQQFTITVTAVNDPPSVVGETFDGGTGNFVAAVGNTQLVFDNSASSPTPAVLVNGDLLDNDSDPADPGTTLSVTTTPVAGPTNGSVTLTAAGAFIYTPNRRFTGSDSFTYQVCDNGTPGSMCANATVTITVANLVWFIDDTSGAATEDGRSNTPYKSFGAFDAANGGGGTDPAAGDTIFVATGSGTYMNASMTLLQNQQLLGEGVGLTVGALTIPAGTRPVLTTTNAHSISLPATMGNTIRGLNIGNTGTGTGVFAIADTSGTLTIDTVTVNGTGGVVDVRDTNDTSPTTLDITFDSITSTGGAANGVFLSGLAGSLTTASTSLTDLSSRAINVQNSSVNGNFGTTGIGTTSSQGVGIALITNTGTSTFNNTSITTSAGIGFNANAGGTVNFTGTAPSINATGGEAVFLSGSTGQTNGATGWTFSSLSSTNSPTSGLGLDSLNNAFTVTGTVSVTSATSSGISILNSNVTHAFSGQVTVNNTATSGNGIDLLNTGTTNFNAGLDIDTTSGIGFSASGGMNPDILNVLNSATETINTTTGPAVQFSNVVLGTNDVSFDSISVSGSPTNANALLFSGVSNAGTFNGGTVTVAGTTTSGNGINISGSSAAFNFASATIDNTVGAGINLTGANGVVTFTTVDIDNTGGVGVQVTGNTDAVNINGGTIGATTSAGGDGVNINGGSANVTIAAAIKQDTANNSVDVQNRTAGTVTFSAAIDDNASGIFLNNNSSSTISLSGGMTLDTGTNTAFTATSGGTVNVTGTNTIGTSGTPITGTAINIVDTAIGSSDVTFRSLNVNGAVNAIILNNTGMAGGLKVTGVDGPCGNTALAKDCDGGTINGTTGPAITLTQSANVSLRFMRLQNTSVDAVVGDRVTDGSGGAEASFEVVSCDFLDIGTSAATDEVFDFATNKTAGTFNITGTLAIDQSVFDEDSGGANNSFAGNALLVENHTGAATINVTNSVFQNTPNTADQAVNLIATGTNATTVTVADSVANEVRGELLAARAEDNTASIDVNFLRNRVQGNNTGGNNIGAGVAVAVNKGASATFDILDNCPSSQTGCSSGCLDCGFYDNFQDPIELSINDDNTNPGGSLEGRVSRNRVEDAIDRAIILLMDGDSVGTTGQEFTANIEVMNNVFLRTGVPSASGALAGIETQIRDSNSGAAAADRTVHLRFVNNELGTVEGEFDADNGMLFNIFNTDAIVNLLLDNTDVRLAASGNSLLREAIHLRARDNATVNATIINGEYVAPADDEHRVRTEQAGSTACLDIRSNTLQGGAGSIQLQETAGNMNVVQTSAANLASVNGIPAGNVDVAGTSPNFGAVANCPQPTAPTNP